jgi:hypothetical protein
VVITGETAETEKDTGKMTAKAEAGQVTMKEEKRRNIRRKRKKKREAKNPLKEKKNANNRLDLLKLECLLVYNKMVQLAASMMT